MILGYVTILDCSAARTTRSETMYFEITWIQAHTSDTGQLALRVTSDALRDVLYKFRVHAYTR